MQQPKKAAAAARPRASTAPVESRRRRWLAALGALGAVGATAGSGVLSACGSAQAQGAKSLWSGWDELFGRAKFVPLSQVMESRTAQAVLPFSAGQPRARPARAELADIEPRHGAPAGTRFDPPSRRHPCQSAIDEVPPTFALRKLVVISIADKVARNRNYHLSIADVRAWEERHGPVPAGSVVMVRSDWCKLWDTDRAAFLAPDGRFPGVGLQALQYLHVRRRILFHGHEPLETDSTPNRLGADWLMANGYAIVDGVANLDQVPETGALLALGFPRFKGGSGSFAGLTAICPAAWPHGLAVGEMSEAPMVYHGRRLVPDASGQSYERSAACDRPNRKLSGG